MSDRCGTGPRSDQSSRLQNPSPITHHSSLIIALFLSCVALGAVFWGLRQIDYPLIRHLRLVHIGWLERVGDLFGFFGSGEFLAVVVGTLFVLGWWRSWPTVRRTGFEGIVAHAASSVVAQTLKHLIGRPRPRMAHGDAFAVGPSFQSGLDSFPSGHSTASFAVAGVIAARFPAFRGAAFGVAGLVAASRVIRGSHFPSDVFAGALVGVLAAALATRPIREWRASLAEGLVRSVPAVAVCFGFLWAVVHRPDVPLEAVLERWDPMAASGFVLVGGGLAGRFYLAARAEAGSSGVWPTITSVSGIGLVSGSWLLVGLACVVTVACWLTPEDGAGEAASRRTVASEAFVAITILGAAFLLYVSRGLLPIL
jgi:undecaprenyl-diphosphatase